MNFACNLVMQPVLERIASKTFVNEDLIVGI
jgi:hypothetical protein